MDYTVLATTIITAITTLGAAFLANNKLSELRNKNKEKIT